MKNRNKLPKFYLVTPDFDGNNDLYLSSLESSLRNGIKLVQLRSKNLSEEKYLQLVKNVLPLIRSYKAKIILNGSKNLLSALDVDGVHLPSSECANLKKRPIGFEYLLSVACHNKEQIDRAENIDADFAVLCPVYSTPSSPKGVPIGWDNFSKFLIDINIPIYALGGLNVKDFETARNKGAYGLAAKRALWNLKKFLPY